MFFSFYFQFLLPRQGGSVVSVSDSWPDGCEFDPRLRQLFFPAYFHLSPLQKHVRKVVGGFGKKSSVSTGVRKPGNTYAVTDRHDMTLAVQVALNPNTTNQTISFCWYTLMHFLCHYRIHVYSLTCVHTVLNLIVTEKHVELLHQFAN